MVAAAQVFLLGGVLGDVAGEVEVVSTCTLVDVVSRELVSIVEQKPLLWVGAGLSVAAGYPSTDTIVDTLRRVADRDLPTGEFTVIVDAFVDAVGEGELKDVLQRLFQASHEPTATHAAIGRLAAAGRFAAIVTTNYDDMLERALAAAGVKVVVQTLEHNAAVREQDGALRLLKIHGSYTAWHDTVLSGRSYANFDARYGFLQAQLDVLLQQHPLLFVGCSLQDPRILGWIESRPADWLAKLKRWRALMRPNAWTAAQAMRWKDGTAGAILSRAPLRAIEYTNHADLPALWLELAKQFAPLGVQELVFDLDPGDDDWLSVGPTPEFAPHRTPNPLRDDHFLRDLRRLRTLMRHPVLEGDPRSPEQTAELHQIGGRVGARLTATLLSPAAREVMCRRLAEVDGTARLTLRIPAGLFADQALALPWELLMPEAGKFAVEQAKLDLVRDAVRPGAPGLDVPSTALSVAATIAAPEDQTALRYEDEAYRLLKALAPLGQIAQFGELGELDDLVELVRRTHATVVHFSGHGLPGALVFEDEFGLSQQVPVGELMTRLRRRVQESGRSQAFPRLFYLASCHGVSTTMRPADGSEPNARTVRDEVSAALGEGPSTAATLHREGFACVLGYFGPIGDATSTSAEVALYTALSEGGTVLQAVKQARPRLAATHGGAGSRYSYPLGWAQLTVYLRGPDRPLTARPHTTDTTALAPVGLVREVVEVSGLPVLEHGFVGRRAIQHEVRHKLKAGQRLLVLQGLGGLGKTALASQVLCKVLTRDPADQLILRAQDGSDIAALRRQAEAHGDTHRFPGWEETVKRLHEQHPEPVAGFQATVVALRAHRPALVLYADNLEVLQVGPGGTAEDQPRALGTWKPGVERWWSAMESLAQNGVVLASTRYLWIGLDREALVALDRMSRPDVWRMLETFPTLARLPWTVREKVVDAVDGRPRTLERLEGLLREADRDPTRPVVDAWTEWVEPVLRQYGARLTEDLLLAQLWCCLSQAARDHAVACSVLNQPAPRRVLDVLGSAAGELVGAGLLTRHRQLTKESRDTTPRLRWRDRWSMHASVRQFAAAWGDPAILRQARTRAANEYAASVVAPGAAWSDQLEAIELYLANGDESAAWPLAQWYVLWARYRAQYHAGLAMLARFKANCLRGDFHVEHTALVAQLQGLAGIRGETSEADLRRGIDTADSPETRALALHELAGVLSSQGKYREAEGLLRESLAVAEEALGGEHPSRGALLHSLAGALSPQGKYEEAAELLRQALAVDERAQGREHPSFSASLHSLAGVRSAQGKYGEAENLLRQSLAIDEKILGREHPDYGASLHALAGVLSSQGKYEDAEELLRESLAVAEKVLGREHPSYGASLHSLAGVLSSQGKYGEAQGLLQESLVVAEKMRGREHPFYGASLHELAGVLYLEGKYGEAEELLRQSMWVSEKALGREHPSYGTSLRSLAVILASQGKYGEAEELLQESLAVSAKALGRGHPSYGASLQALAGVLSSQGKYGEAEELLRESLAVRKNALGREHPSYGASLQSLAEVLSSQGKYGEAEGLMRESLAIAAKALGREHPSYSTSLQSLAEALSLQGKYREAEGLLQESLAVAAKALGREHPDYGAQLHALAGVLVRQGRYEEAEEMLRESQAVAVKALGREHPSYGASLHALAEVLFSQGKTRESEKLLRESLAVAAKGLGCEHPDYGASLHALAVVLSSTGKYGEAEALLRQALVVREKALGREHPDYGASLHVLADVLSSQGMYEETEKLRRQSLAVTEKALGREHPDYGASLHSLAVVLSLQGKNREAEPLLRESLAVKETALGREHRSYGTSLHALAVVLSSQGGFEEAEELLRQSLAVTERALGREHPDYAASLHALAGVLSSRGTHGEAEELLRQVLAILETRGREHPMLCPTLANLAVMAALQGRPSEGISFLERAITIGHAKLGDDHPDMHHMRELLAQLAGKT